MQIINPKVSDDISKNVPLRLNLGAGISGPPGFYNVDLVEAESVDIVADLNEELKGIPDDSVELIFSNHALEHITNLDLLLEEIFRISKKDARITLTVPHYSNPFFYSDPTHVRFFGLYTLYYFVDKKKQPSTRKVPVHYTHARFIVDGIYIGFYKLTWFDRLLVPFLSWFVNRSLETQVFFERRLASIFHAWQITYTIHPDKQ